MQAHAMSLAALVRYTEDATGNVYFDDTLLPSSIDPNHPDLFAVWADRSGLVARSDNWPQGLEIPSAPNHHWNFEWNRVPYHALRVSQVPILDREEGKAFRPQTLTIFYAAPTIRLRMQVRRAGAFIALAGMLLLAATVLLALRGIRRGLRPLQNLAQEASRVSAQNWELRLPEEVSQIKELRPVTQSMKQMLERLQHSFEQQRQFLGNAAHELKTPVAVMKSTLQSLVQRPRTEDEYRTGIQQSLEDLERLEQLLQWMLRLARAEQWAHGALRRDLEVIDINATCEEAIERIRNLAQSRNTAVHLSTNGPVPFRADPEDLQLVWKICNWSGLICWKTRYVIVPKEARSKWPSRAIMAGRSTSLSRITVQESRRMICPTFLSASIVATARAPAPPADSAWDSLSPKLWWKPTAAQFPPKASRAGARE